MEMKFLCSSNASIHLTTVKITAENVDLGESLGCNVLPPDPRLKLYIPAILLPRYAHPNIIPKSLNCKAETFLRLRSFFVCLFQLDLARSSSTECGKSRILVDVILAHLALFEEKFSKIPSQASS
jgi:hypothetical protein